MSDPNFPSSGHDNPGEWWQQPPPPSAEKPNAGTPLSARDPSAAVPRKRPPALRTWAKVLGGTMLVLVAGMAVLVFVVLWNKDPVKPQPDTEDVRLPVDQNTTIGQKQDAGSSAALGTGSKLPPQTSHADAMQRILGHDLHPNPPAIATQSLEPPHLESPPPPKEKEEVKPPEEKKPPPVTEKPPEEKKQPVREKPPVTTPNADALFEKRLARSEADLRKELSRVPELRLLSDLDLKTLEEAQRVAELGGRLGSSTYVLDVRMHQSLTKKALKNGLPLRSGLSCRLDGRTALVVQTVSKELRNMGFVSLPGVSMTLPRDRIAAFKKWCDENSVEKYTGALATFVQMLQVEDAPTRLVLVREMARSKDAGSSVVLAMRALTDPAPKVRNAAVAALKKRPAAEYQGILLTGFSYPWPPIADHAAQALTTLELKDAVPQLVKLLDQPDPALPVFNKAAKTRTVREMVRLNHMRNCFLCHPPSSAATDGMVRGIVPIPGKPMPPAYEMGMAPSPVNHLVRADTTFLRQDFSLNLKVESPGTWPAEQRFDYLVRRRVVPLDKETETNAKLQAGFPQREALTYTLRKLTGKDGGDSRKKWEELLFITTDDKDKGSGVEEKKLTPEMAHLDEKAVPFLRFAKKLIDDGMLDKAEQRLREIVREYPGTPSADEAKRLLQKLQDKK